MILHKRKITNKCSKHNRMSNSILKSTGKKQKAFKESKNVFIGKEAVFVADNRY